MRQATSPELSKKVKDCAILLEDETILAKLAITDMHVLKSSYHLKCLASLYNRCKLAKNVNSDCTESAAFIKVLTYLKDESSKEKGCYFKLKDLFDMYLDKTNGNSDERKSNKTRFKDSLLAYVPTLCEIKAGRDVFLIMKSNLETFFDESKRPRDEKDTLIRAAEIVRESIDDYTLEVDEENMEISKKSIPKKVVTFVRMILEGPSVVNKEFDFNNHDIAAESISQLIVFNSIKRRRNASTTRHRHSVKTETPLPIFNALKVHVQTRNKSIIETQHRLGLSISYKRTLQITDFVKNAVCQDYIENGVVCPPHIPKGIFTTAALDNLDHDPSSTTKVSE